MFSGQDDVNSIPSKPPVARTYPLKLALAIKPMYERTMKKQIGLVVKDEGQTLGSRRIGSSSG